MTTTSRDTFALPGELSRLILASVVVEEKAQGGGGECRKCGAEQDGTGRQPVAQHAWMHSHHHSEPRLLRTYQLN